MLCLALAVGPLATATAGAGEWAGLFDVEARTEELRGAQFAPIREACLAQEIGSVRLDLKPISGLRTTPGYGSDNSAEDFSWTVMVLAGRALAGDAGATNDLRELLLRWSDAGAFEETDEAHNSYYALKRQLLPLSVAYQILEPSLDEDEARKLRDWIDPLVRRIDKLFDGDVDKNNHRTLADSILAVWGSIVGDESLMQKGFRGYVQVLGEIRADGTLPLEARRGSRALWYQRQTLSSLVVIAEVARGAGRDLYGETTADRKGFATLSGGLLNGLTSPILVTVYSSENHIPGPEDDYLAADLSFLDVRGHGRHYMAWTEAVVDRDDGLSSRRLSNLFADEVTGERPLIDEFAGGNATCFWGRS